jgi:hypothetical protein
MRQSLLLPVMLLSACNGSNNVSGDGGGPGSPDLAPGALTVAVSIGPIPLAAAEERTVCKRFKLPTTTAINVVQIDSQLAPGSHHLVLYRSTATTEQTTIYDCPPLDISTGDIPIYIAETQADNLLPLPTGAAYQFEAGQMVRMEAHYLNASPNAIMGMGTIELTEGDPDPSKYQAADIMFCGTVTALSPGLGTGVPPGMTTLPAGFYAPPAGIKVFGLTTHEHKRGSLMTIDKSTSTAPGANLVMGTPYDNPPFVIYRDNDLLTFGANEGLRWQCEYNNTTTTTYYFGQSAQSNEMCFLWAYYYPSVGHFISRECWR